MRKGCGIEGGTDGELLMKSGDFAAFCATTKETLRHYRSIGLLKPAAVSKTGYALYAAWQWADFILIESLQDSGCTLAQIKLYLDTPSSQELEEVLSERIEAIERERRRLIGRQQLLEGTLRRMRTLKEWRQAGTTFRLERRERCFLREVHLPALDGDETHGAQMVQQVRSFTTLYRDMLERGSTGELQLVYRLDKADMSAGTPPGYAHVCVPTCSGSGNVVRPAGTYLAWLRSCTFEEELGDAPEPPAPYLPILQELDRRGLTAQDDFFETELSLYSGNMGETLYSEVSVLVCADERA